MSAVLQDLRYAVRIFARRRTLTVVAILSLAVATGPNAALFGLINGLFFQHLPVDHPDQLLDVRAMKGARAEAIAIPDWLDIKRQTASLAGVIAWERVLLALSIEAHQEVLTGNYVSADYFTLLGVKPAIGRVLSPELDEQTGPDLPLVISYSYWQRRFAGAPDVVGMTARMAGRPLVIVGVAPRGFRGMDVHLPIDGWIPYSAVAAIWGSDARAFTDREHGRLSTVLGRVKPGATMAQAEADLAAIGTGLAQAYPATNQGRRFHARSYADDRNAKGLTAGALAIGLVSLVLLVACANVAGLLLSLAEARRGEIAVRLSLGASRWRLVRQLLTESVLLWLAGALVGLLLAAWLMKLPIAPPMGGLTLDYDIHFDWAVFLYAVCLACFTAVLFGLAPAVQATKADLVTSVKAGREGRSPWRSGTRNALVISQIAVSQFLLAGALLGVRSYMNLHEFRPGFDSDKSILVATLVPGTVGGAPVTAASQDLLVDRLRQLPGVVQVSAAGSIPLSGSGGGAMQRVAWPGAAEDVEVRSNRVAPKYFSVMGIHLLRGREFETRDLAPPSHTVIVNHTLALRVAPDGDALDQWIRVADVPHQIVGVAEDGAYLSLRDSPEPYIYLPSRMPGLLLIETAIDPGRVTDPIRRVVEQVAPGLYLADVSTLGEVMRFARYADELSVGLVGILGVLALFLTSVGVYGLVAHSVTSRTHEFGVRMALGAERRDILGMVLAQGLRLTAIGAPVGLAAAVAGGIVIANVLFGISPADPWSYLAGAVGMAVAVGLACLGPALRASDVEPATALRHE